MSGNLISFLGNESTGFENAHYDLSPPSTFSFTFLFPFFISHSFFPFTLSVGNKMESMCIYRQKRIE